MPGPDPLCGHQPFGGTGRWHPDVGHHEIRLLFIDEAGELLPVAGLAHEREAVVTQDAGDALPEQNGVVGEDHPKWPLSRIRAEGPRRVLALGYHTDDRHRSVDMLQPHRRAILEDDAVDTTGQV